MTTKRKRLILLLIVLSIVLLAELIFVIYLELESAKENVQATEGKQPDRYSWEEYQQLTKEEQEAFFAWFGSVEAFEGWLESVRPSETVPSIPQWNKPGKLPNEYTWEEYQQLTNEEQEAFFAWFGSVEAFEAWLESVRPSETEPTTPQWDKPGKLPNKYTWEEYQQLTHEEQDAFFNWFDSAEAFEAWMESARPAETEPTTPQWNKPGKLPNKYTWEEYQQLTNEEQQSFYNWFDSVEAFEAWMESARPAETEPTTPQWNKPGKLPNKYTWEEYQQLTSEEQEAFYNWFDSVEAFEAWQESVRPAETEPTTPQWGKPGKLPNEYTWEEYQQLTHEEQDMFFNWFDSVEAFEAWVEGARPAETEPTTPQWGKPGKLPNEYTWEEYQQLTHEEQDMFFNWFDSVEAFEAWMENARPAETEPATPQWNKPGKLPNEYTWKEYQQLTHEEQDMFFNWFDSVEAFEAWIESARPAETEPATPQWNKPGKLPSEYTWEEYQQLTNEEQEAFFAWFGSVEAFEAWMESMRPADTEPSAPQWNKPGKLPSEYTWEEYQQLTHEEQDAFFYWFDSVEAFEAWMNATRGA